jgi:hypothetical protein
MKILTIEVDEFELHSVLLNAQIAGCLDRVGQVTGEILMNGRARRDAASCDMLPLLVRGFGVLARLGDPRQSQLRTDARSVIDAHTASCVVAGSKGLSQQERADTLTSLGFLARILPCWVLSENLPPWNQIQNYGLSRGRVQQIYEVLLEQRTNEDGLRPIKMGDALALHAGLKLRVHPAILRLWEDLSQVTASHRHALACLMGGAL